MLQEFIAEEFTKGRKAMGISQRELAQRCGLPQSTVGRIEAGLVVPTLLTRAKIAEVLQREMSGRPKDRRGTV